MLVDGEAAEHPQHDPAAAGRVDDAPALLCHQVLRLEQSVSWRPAVHARVCPARLSPEALCPGQESGQGGGCGMSPHPTPSSSSRTAAQSPAEKWRVASGSSSRSSCASRSSRASTQPRSALGDRGSVVALDGETQAAQHLQRLRLATLKQSLRAVDSVHLKSREPGLLLAPEAQLHGGQPLHEPRNERLLPLPAPPRGRARRGDRVPPSGRRQSWRTWPASRRRVSSGCPAGGAASAESPDAAAVATARSAAARPATAASESAASRAAVSASSRSSVAITPARRHLQQRRARFQAVNDVAQLAEPPLVIGDAPRGVGHPRLPARLARDLGGDLAHQLLPTAGSGGAPRP